MGGRGGGNQLCRDSLAMSWVTARWSTKSALAPTMKINRSGEQFFFSSVFRLELNPVRKKSKDARTFEPASNIMK